MSILNMIENIGTNTNQEIRYEADDYAMPGLGYFESEPMCHCVQCEKKRQVLNKLTNESPESSEIERDQTES